MSREDLVRAAYEGWHQGWNAQDATAMSSWLSENASVVGFDGSQMNGRENVHQALDGIFKHHPTGFYVWIVQEIRFVGESAAIVRAVSGMVPRGGSSVNPNVNAVQTMMCVEHEGKWLAEIVQNTPAAFHGRPEEKLKLTQELQAIWESKPH